MNEKLIKQVQEGTHCIEFNLHKDSPETLRTVTKQVWSNALAQPNGTEEYYFNFIDPQHWDSKTTLPSNLTPIPLDDFFKEDCELPEVKCHICGNLITTTGTSILGKPVHIHCYHKPPTPEQPLPEELTAENDETLDLALGIVEYIHGDVNGHNDTLGKCYDFINNLKSINNGN